jgi:hypothetical protein
MAIKAIDTEYKGYLFRSRLEARWAVFLDALKVAWEYEKEGYDLGEAGWYLPDFWLPELNCWAEIKPDEPSKEDRAKMKALVMETKIPVVLFVGTPDEDECGVSLVKRYFWDATDPGMIPFMLEDPHYFGGAETVAQKIKHGIVWDFDIMTYRAVFGNRSFTNAIRAARSARFEHGQSGRQL